MSNRSCSGQALTEALLAVAALSAAFAAVVLLGKYQAVKAAAIGAAALTVFECTVRPGACADANGPAVLQDELRGRYFSAREDAPRSDSASPAGAIGPTRVPLWSTRTGDPLLERFEDVRLVLSNGVFDAGESVATRSNAAGAVAGALIDAGPVRFGLATKDGLRRAEVKVDLQPARHHPPYQHVLAGIALRMSERSALLADEWSASGPYGPGDDAIAVRVESGSTLASVADQALRVGYAPVESLVREMSRLGLESTGDAFSHYQIDVDLVPDDRLGR